jgi:hypothetical protein
MATRVASELGPHRFLNIKFSTLDWEIYGGIWWFCIGMFCKFSEDVLAIVIRKAILKVGGSTLYGFHPRR